MDFSMTDDGSITDGSIRGAGQNYLYNDLDSMASAIMRRDLIDFIDVVDWAMGTCDEISLKPVHELITGGPCLDSPVYEELLLPSTMVEVSFDGIKNTIAYCADDDESVTEVLEDEEGHAANESRKMVYLRREYSQKSILDAPPSGEFPMRLQHLQQLRSTGSRRSHRRSS
jgi:hypothetical protein